MTDSSLSQDAVVVGSGFGGLAAAVRLGALGYRVTLLERMSRPGGKASVLAQDGFTFDAGPTVVTAPHLFEELWSLAGKRMSDHVPLRKVDPLYDVRFEDGSVFRFSDDHEGMCAEVARFSPDDVSGYEAFTTISEKIFRLGFEGLVDQPFMSWRSMLRIVPQMIKLRSYRTVYGMVAKYVRDEKVRQVLTFHTLLVGGNPFTTTSIYCLINRVEQKWGVHYPVGGTGALVRGLVDLIEGQGGTVRCQAEVSQIMLDGRRACGVRLSDGEEIPARIVVSDADSVVTYGQLVPAHARRRWTDKRLARQKLSMSCFLWYFGTSRKYEDVAQHTILLGPRYRPLLEDIFDRKVLAKDFSLYLHRPTATDPTLAPDGCDGFYALSPVPHLGSGIDWAEQAEPYRQSIASFLEQTVLPELQQSVISSATMTPLDFKERMNAFQGATFGLQPILTQSAYFRPHNKSEDIENLFLVGAGTHPGAGLPGVVASARVLDRLIPPVGGKLEDLPSPHVFQYRQDLGACREKLRIGSKSFAAAGKLLPKRIRGAVTALYAFCREADDAVDQVAADDRAKLADAVTGLHKRVDRIYANNPIANPVDRAFCRVVHTFALPREIVLALIEGFEWDADQRRYRSLEDLEAYCARVASAVGVLMTLLMGPRQAQILARACDLGLAMQLTNICRDVGEDARAGRIYLPLDWLAEEGIDPKEFVAQPVFDDRLARLVERLLKVADAYYEQADVGISLLPKDCRTAICGARLIYADIGRVIRDNGCDSISRRAYTSKMRKVRLLMQARRSRSWPARENAYPPAKATQFLIDSLSSERN